MSPADVRTLARELLADREFRSELAVALAVEAGRLAYSVDECAVRAGVGRDLIYAELKAGRLTAWSVGARRLIRRETLERWAAEREAEGRRASA